VIGRCGRIKQLAEGIADLFEGVSEVALRFGVFAGVFVLLAGIELLRPRRRSAANKVRRWATNLAIVSIDGLVVRAMAMLAVPLAGTAAAVYAATHGIGLLNWLEMPSWVEAVLAIIALDFSIWMQHVATHKVPLLWRLHQVHHADIDFDVTTAVRFHPVEIALSVLWKIVCVLLLGPSVLAVVLFEIILNASAMFSHANIELPSEADRRLRLLIVTPDMHRVHHSVISREHHSNFGFNLSIWDRIFGTYRAQPEKGHENMMIGLPAYQSDEPAGLVWSLTLPFRWSKRPPAKGRTAGN
jgi:sterol desaturase/sphingolipid hydroxylase (fatty acid hydroxylase superfamily)